MSLVDELARLEEERRKLDDEQKAFSEHLERLRKAKDQDEFDRFMAERKAPSAEPPDAESGAPAAAAAALNRLRRSRSGQWLGGVCAGIAQVSGVETWIWRLLFALLFIFGGTGLLIYLLLWIFVPLE